MLTNKRPRLALQQLVGDAIAEQHPLGGMEQKGEWQKIEGNAHEFARPGQCSLRQPGIGCSALIEGEKHRGRSTHALQKHLTA
ncbi:hypothetical protein GGR20_002522 [Devosia subaequoris]|uniref:Uncharacterized protein n=1 Tax=Devosia subaequoris TaxID=395930 RepID=A0A7W6NCK8_9HYPH|nr:hypothetical protein [Devosia subaequoris]MBB4052874.1 hypothetical protein [Devosia subaequoris]MCP1210025.1 hypothetical protein [Devosia subaequoris]